MSICCIIGHNDICFTPQLQDKLYQTIEHLVNLGIDSFYIVRENMFTLMCLETIALLHKQYPNIRRVYLDFEHNPLKEELKKYLITTYDSLESPESFKLQKKKTANATTV